MSHKCCLNGDMKSDFANDSFSKILERCTVS